jgi:integrase/recombinase XerC
LKERDMWSLIEEFLAQGNAQGWSEGTVKEYRSRLKYLVEYLMERGRKRVTEVKVDDIEAYFSVLRAQGLRHKVRQCRASTARLFFTWLAERGRILSNPTRTVTIRQERGDGELLEAPMEDAEVADLLDSLPRRDVVDLRNRLHLELLYASGLRVAESLALDVADLDLGGRTLRVRKGKGAKERLVPVMRGLHAAVKDYLALRRSLLRGPDQGALLLSCRGTRLSEAGFRDWLRKLNLTRCRVGKRPIHPHLLRHSIAVHLLRGGADIRHVQEFLGHESLEYTKTYLRLVPADLRAEYDRAMPVIAVNAS